ncbi:MAG TPA: hypothetical protein ACFYD3_09775 [Candidatus Hypogeohydataceae bacterium YC41]
MRREQEKKKEAKQKQEQELEGTKPGEPPKTSSTSATSGTSEERRLIEGKWYKKTYVADPLGSGHYEEVWVPEK